MRNSMKQEPRDFSHGRFRSKIMPKLVVGGMACMISIVVAGIIAPML
ncbi:hypothetical protein [Clostridioides sp. ZZV15-6598]|nr:hypothetical protein [Clostridioides sp. ZZV15-6598]